MSREPESTGKVKKKFQENAEILLELILLLSTDRSSKAPSSLFTPAPYLEIYRNSDTVP